MWVFAKQRPLANFRFGNLVINTSVFIFYLLLFGFMHMSEGNTQYQDKTVYLSHHLSNILNFEWILSVFVEIWLQNDIYFCIIECLPAHFKIIEKWDLHFKFFCFKIAHCFPQLHQWCFPLFCLKQIPVDVMLLFYKMILFFYTLILTFYAFNFFCLGRSHLTKAPCWWLLKGCRANFINYFWPSIHHILLNFLFSSVPLYFLFCIGNNIFEKFFRWTKNLKKFCSAATKTVFPHLLLNSLCPSLFLLLFVSVSCEVLSSWNVIVLCWLIT